MNEALEPKKQKKSQFKEATIFLFLQAKTKAIRSFGKALIKPISFQVDLSFLGTFFNKALKIGLADILKYAGQAFGVGKIYYKAKKKALIVWDTLTSDNPFQKIDGLSIPLYIILESLSVFLKLLKLVLKPFNTLTGGLILKVASPLIKGLKLLIGYFGVDDPADQSAILKKLSLTGLKFLGGSLLLFLAILTGPFGIAISPFAVAFTTIVSLALTFLPKFIKLYDQHTNFQDIDAKKQRDSYLKFIAVSTSFMTALNALTSGVTQQLTLTLGKTFVETLTTVMPIFLITYGLIEAATATFKFIQLAQQLAAEFNPEKARELKQQMFDQGLKILGIVLFTTLSLINPIAAVAVVIGGALLNAGIDKFFPNLKVAIINFFTPKIKPYEYQPLSTTPTPGFNNSVTFEEEARLFESNTMHKALEQHLEMKSNNKNINNQQTELKSGDKAINNNSTFNFFQDEEKKHNLSLSPSPANNPSVDSKEMQEKVQEAQAVSSVGNCAP